MEILDEKGLKNILKKKKVLIDTIIHTVGGRVYTGQSTNQDWAIFELKSDAVLIKSEQ